MTDEAWKKVGLAAVILLAPGGFVLGATLLARRYKAKREAPPPHKD
jgi:hypothetical protein